MWTLVAGFLVMFMQLGFALLETGLTRAKNAAHTMSMNLMVYGIGILGWWDGGMVGRGLCADQVDGLRQALNSASKE